MLTIPPATRVFLATAPTDMRKSFDGLYALVENVLQEAPLSGHLFVFRNRRRDRLKVLWWDQDGLALFYKRLERGTYRFPTDVSSTPTGSTVSVGKCEIRASDLALLLEGIELRSVTRRKRFELPGAGASASRTSQPSAS